MTELYINTDPSPARIIQMTDTHIGANESFIFNGVSTLTSLSRVVGMILEQEQPDVVLVTGDLVHDPVPAAYSILMEQLVRLEVPVCCLPGNHDDPVLMEKILNSNNVCTDKKIRINDWVILMLNSYLSGSHGGGLADTELQFLEQQLTAHLQQSILIAVHHHPVRIYSPWMDAIMLKNPDKFFSVIDRFTSVKAVIWGHIHQQFEVQRAGVELWGCPSTCAQFKPETLALEHDTLTAGYRHLELADKGGILSKVIRLSS